ncbi:MAG: hypothetical protein U9R57_11905 [Thermodesulfobacteriota bacterium]|nr:hypothetical protein [Thermodesulfobacteriota bacterium]
MNTGFGTKIAETDSTQAESCLTLPGDVVSLLLLSRIDYACLTELLRGISTVIDRFNIPCNLSTYSARIKDCNWTANYIDDTRFRLIDHLSLFRQEKAVITGYANRRPVRIAVVCCCRCE